MHAEIVAEDPETEVALNLICVDESTRKAIEIPIRPRPVKDLINEVRKSGEMIKSDPEHKTKLASKDLNSKSGKLHFGLFSLVYSLAVKYIF